MPTTVLPDTTNAGPWHHYTASKTVNDAIGLPILKFTEHASEEAKAIVAESPMLIVRLQKLLETARRYKNNDSEKNLQELETQLTASNHLLKLLFK